MKPSKIMAVLVSAATLSSTAGMTAFAADNGKKAADNKYSYVALGDSIAAGFGLAGGDLAQDPALIITDELLADPVKGAYPAIFTESLEKFGTERGYSVKGTNLASTAYRAEDIENAIKTEGYKGEFASGILESYVGEGASDALSRYHDIFTKNLSDADLVSIQLGGNDIIMSIVPKMVYSDNPILSASGMSLMLTLFGTDTKTAIGGGLQIIAENKDKITSENFLEAATFMYNVGASADALVDESASHVKAVVEAVKSLNSNADIALVGMFNPYRTAEEKEEMKEDIFEVVGKIYAEAAKAAAESENELTAGGKQTMSYINDLSSKVDQIVEIKAVMEKYKDSAELQELMNMVMEYDDINEVRELAELVGKSEGKPGKIELMALLVKYNDLAELQSVIDIIRNYDDISELTELVDVMAKYRTASEAAVENALAAEVGAPMAMQVAGRNVDPQMRRLNEDLKVVAEATGAIYVDVYGISPEDDFDPHPNANGHKEIADILYNSLSDLVSSRMMIEEAVTTTKLPTSTVTTTTTAKTTAKTSATTANTTAKPETDATTTTAAKSKYVPLKAKRWGDANVDNIVNVADAVFIMQSIANPDAYKLTEQGIANADVYMNGTGITGQDAVSIQKYLLRLLSALPTKS